MPAPFLATYRDLIEHLLGFGDGLATEVAHRRARSAIQSAYRDLCYVREWRYLRSHGRIRLYPSYTTGTVAYDATTRIVTLTGGVFPTWARYGHITFGSRVVHKISERTDDTHCTLEPRFAPTADLAAGTKYRVYRSVYALPGDLWSIDEIHDENNAWSRGYMPADEWLVLERTSGGSERPFAWTVMGSPDLYGSLQVALDGYPPSAESLDFIYTRRARDLRLDGYTNYSSLSGGRISDSAGTAVNLTVAVSPEVIGAIFRAGQSGATSEPESMDSVNRYVYQRAIMARPSAQVLTLDLAVPDLPVGDRYTIADPIDLPGYLYSALLRGAEYQYILMTDPARAPAREGVYGKALRLAMGADGSVKMPDGVQPWRGWHHPAWRLLTGTVTPSGGA